jgi:P4 family phage/plasmid primase-like protien
MSSYPIFSTLAPAYWAAGLQAIPLWQGEKRPAINDWSRFAETPLSDAERAAFLAQHPNGNIGLALGPASGIVAIDIDTDDTTVLGILKRLLPFSPWTRIGKKGKLLAYRFNGQPTFRIKDANGAMLVEHLSAGTQCVLPGSIHPETKLPYEADSDLFDPAVLNSLAELPPEFEAILRSALEEGGVKLSVSGRARVTDYVGRGARDVQMISVAGHYANGVLRGELTFQQAINRMVAWKSSCVEAVAGDDIDIEKGIVRLAEFIIGDVTGPKMKTLPKGWDEGLSDEEKALFGFDIFDAKHEEWDYERLKAFIRNAFMVNEPDTVGRDEARIEFMKQLSRSKVSKFDEERLLKYVVAAGQFGVLLSTLKAELRQLRQGELTGDNHQEIAEAILMDLNRRIGFEMKNTNDAGWYRFNGNKFWKWIGTHWEEEDESKILRHIGEEFGNLAVSKRASDYRELMKYVAQLCKGELKNNAEAGINFANGFLTRGLELVPHHPDYGCTYTLPYRYMPERADQGEMFFEFLKTSWGQDRDYQQKMDALQEALAVTLFGVAPDFQRAFCLHGPPKSGKSQMLKIIESLLPGQQQCAIPPQQWGDKFLPAQLHNKLLNVCGELSEKHKINGQSFKQIVVGETITGQHKNQNAFSFQPRCAHWFATNHVPRTDDTSDAFNRRWLLLTFERVVKDATRVIDIGSIIAAMEREEIAAWAVLGIVRLRQQKDFTLPESHKERIAEIARANNALRSFILDSGSVILGGLLEDGANSSIHISETEIYNAYFTFALAAGDAKPAYVIGFRQQMRELGFEMGFRTRVRHTESGGQDCVYENITLAKGNVVSLRK